MEKEKSLQETYLREVDLQLRRAGFETEPPKDGYMPVRWEGAPLCRVTEGGGVQYHAEDVEDETRRSMFNTLVDITGRVSEYVRLMENAPPLTCPDLRDRFKLLAEFNGIVLAGRKYEKQPGYQFVTWERTFDGDGVVAGNYYENYMNAKADFAIRSGLVQKGRQFSDKQLTEVYQCIQETMDGDEPIAPEREQVLKDTMEQIENTVPDLNVLMSISAIRDENYRQMLLGQMPELG